MSTQGSGVTGICPLASPGDDQWTCAMQAVPYVIKATGITDNCGYEATGQPSCGCDSSNVPYEVDYPITDNGNPSANEELCVCPDLAGWGSPGAPPRSAVLCGSGARWAKMNKFVGNRSAQMG